MTKRFFAKLFPLRMGLLAATLGIGGLAGLAGCGEVEIDSLQQELIETKAAKLDQRDFDTFLDAIKLKNCSFVVAAGTGTFTPSNELSQALYGDPVGSAHKTTFSVPVITSGTNTFEITSLEAEMANTGITLAGANATVKLAFHGVLKISVTVPLLGKLPAEIQIKSSSLSAALSYDKAAERARVASVTTKFDVSTKKCGGSGWCNGLVDGILKSNLASWVEAPLRDALTKALDSDSTTNGLNDLLAAGYNVKDPKTPAWKFVAKSLTLSGGAFNFTVER